MEYFTEWSFKRWADLISGKHADIDNASFFLASVLPIAEIVTDADGNLDVAVELTVLEKYTPFANEGLKILVDKGFAKWRTEGKKKVGVSVGYTTNGMSAQLYMSEDNKQSTRKAKPKKEFKKSVVALSKDSQDGLSINLKESCPEVIQQLDTFMQQYENFCKKLRLKSAPDKVHDLIKNFIEAADIGMVNSDVLLGYLAGVNAMVYEELKITPYKNPKHRTVANKILSKATPKELFSIVPDFVLNYPEMAKGNFSEPNIFNLSYHILTFKRRAGKSTKTKKWDSNDTL
jgi:predicted transcriptional regulator